MPNLVAYLHVRLNLNIAEDAEIHRNITRLPEGERSRTIRVALLAYFKGESAGRGKIAKRTMSKHAAFSEPGSRTKTVSSAKTEEAAGVLSGNNESHPTIKDSGTALDNMLDLIQ